MKLTVISLGAGVQSSTMALMAAHGEITPMPDCAIFADTGWEPAAVYEWLDWLEGALPFPVHRVSNGDMRAIQLTARLRKKTAGDRYAALPYYVDSNGAEGRVKRQCTGEYKIVPIEREIRRLLGVAKGDRRVITYTTHLIAAGYAIVGQRDRSEKWHRRARPRVTKHEPQRTFRWACDAP